VQPVHARYELLDVIGSGSVAVVYRALDRLSGQLVTLKRLRTQHDQDGRTRSSHPTDRVALAGEFRLLATLRHPNVISVLDYGFDSTGQPFFTMILEEGGTSIVEAARGRTLEGKVALLVETLRGLAYVHRRGIVHRDVKPENILVVGGHVRLLDFGLSALREDLAPDGSLTGTFDYLAPEVLRGDAPTEQSDLFAVGVVAYEILAGRHPFAAHDLATSWANVLTGRLPLPDPDVDPRLEPVLGRLLARDPAARFRDASEVAVALAAALGTPVAFQTRASRESFLQQAAFVGRTVEMEVLGEALVASLSGRGSTWLVGGESGVGKSRLLEELRVLALVQGVTVARGQAPSVGGAPYQAWREPLRLLALNATSIDDRLIAALEPAVPDLASMLGRASVEAEEIDDGATQTRLLHAVQELLRRQRTPTAVFLEDLQWAGSESVTLLAGLARVAAGERVLAVASYRREERPSLPDEIPGARSLQLGRLGEPAVRTLAESMIGAGANAPEFVDYLCRETEGVPFFLVEVVRALADEAGDLARIPHIGLPKLAVPGGIQQLLRRRLSRVGAFEFEALRAAAVVGREIDARVMGALDPALVDDAWLTTCAAVGILDAEEDRFRFAHDKVREQLVADLSAEAAIALHRRVALAIETAHPDDDAHSAALAHHWRAARDAVREAQHATRAGAHALESGAWREAIAFFERALEARGAGGVEQPYAAPVVRRSIMRRLDPNSRVSPESGRFTQARLESGIAEAWFRLGDLEACRRHGVRALRLDQQGSPPGFAGEAAAV